MNLSTTITLILGIAMFLIGDTIGDKATMERISQLEVKVAMLEASK